ncbi:MAG TPA: hypothetical protein VLM40_22260, partial [Gemmata sp.]|nr:hypothetical protein [Gemmata sp.]
MNASDLPAAPVPPSAPNSGKELLKFILRGAAFILVLPVLVVFWLNAILVGRNRALESASQLL